MQNYNLVNSNKIDKFDLNELEDDQEFAGLNNIADGLPKSENIVFPSEFIFEVAAIFKNDNPPPVVLEYIKEIIINIKILFFVNNRNFMNPRFIFVKINHSKINSICQYNS